MNESKFGLAIKDWELIERLLLNPLKQQQAKVWIFGSRAILTHKKFSDIDVLYESTKNLPSGFLSKIKEDLENSRLPIKVDLVNVEDLAESYKTTILEQRIEI